MKVLGIFLAAALAVTATPALAQQTQPGNDQSTTQQTTTTTTTTTVDKDPNADLDDAAAMGPNHLYGDPICGTWTSGTWTPNGHCPDYKVGPHRARLAGTITKVDGHLVTVQQSTRTVVINDQPALNNKMSGKVATGRQIIAYGYWVGPNFYATIIE